MRGERQLLRLGEYLVGQACQRLPPDMRQERYREWTAELPAVLHDQRIRPAAHRVVRMLGYAADTIRAAGRTPAARPPSRGRRQSPGMTGVLYLILVASLASVAWEIWVIVQAPGHPRNYVDLAWGLLLVAYPLSILVDSAARVSRLIVITSSMVGIAVSLWDAHRAPGDWANYFTAALLFLPLLAMWLAHRWTRTRRA
jgi:hypothetical protein